MARSTKGPSWTKSWVPIMAVQAGISLLPHLLYVNCAPMLFLKLRMKYGVENLAT